LILQQNDSPACSKPDFELLEVERLSDVIVRPGGESVDQVPLSLLARAEDDIDVRCVTSGA
jgi:hypothetical protein